jgi:TetR/AcrR family tetracycline transcriptional repressor
MSRVSVRSRSPRRRVLQRESVVARALKVADQEGIEKVSFRRLAADLGVTPMALYTHVRDKADLLDAMAEAVLSEIRLPAASGLEWSEKLRQSLHAVYAVFDRHPSTGAVLARPLLSPASMRILEMWLTVLGEAGFDLEESIRLIQALTAMILGGVVLSSAYGHLAGQSDETARQESQDYALFTSRLPADQYPMLVSVLPVFLDWGSGVRQRELTIELVVGGLKAMANRRRSSPEE